MQHYSIDELQPSKTDRKRLHVNRIHKRLRASVGQSYFDDDAAQEEN